MNTILSLTIIGVTALFLIDVSCYFWLRHNEFSRLIGARRARRPN